MHSGSAGSKSGARLMVLSAGDAGALVLLEIRLNFGATDSCASASWKGLLVGLGVGFGGSSSLAEKVFPLFEDVLSWSRDRRLSKRSTMEELVLLLRLRSRT